jgi:hypothetical protein
MATERLFSDIYPFRVPIPFRERKEDTFSCKGKALERDIKPPETYSTHPNNLRTINSGQHIMARVVYLQEGRRFPSVRTVRKKYWANRGLSESSLSKTVESRRIKITYQLLKKEHLESSAPAQHYSQESFCSVSDKETR